ncbi:hypothetical protein LTR64_008351 [Lithohypha guttulata]|uniref:uncharacterized protein n=1 Tax=Lithohypha guttulata TaxID=1690604 RepID=UPI002DDF356D|nr:hypothetical protein LTR51_008603 [Lithohypha guttulata]
MTPVTVISGGQTGVDTAALLAAKAFSLPISGYVPLHYTNELGAYSIPERFRANLVETGTTASALRTELNIKQADGVLTLLSAEAGKSDVSKGTQLGIDYARTLGKAEEQLCFVDLTTPNSDVEVEKVVAWLVYQKTQMTISDWPQDHYSVLAHKACARIVDLFELQQFVRLHSGEDGAQVKLDAG